MRTRRAFWTTIALAALVACQTGGGGPPQVLSFTADPSAITAGGSSTLRWLVSGATTISVAPGVGDVSGTNSTVVTPATTTTYTLTASGSGSSATAGVTVTVDTSVDVVGHVLGLDGRPAPGVLVDVLGVGGTTSGFDGGFAIPGVEPPYTIHVRHPSEPLAVTYVGLTVPDPVLIVSGTPTGAPHTVFFTGTVSGGTNFPQPMGAVTRTTLASPAVRRTVDADGATGGYRIPLATATPPSLTWHGADVPAALHALQWFVGANGLPADYVGHGVRLFDLKGGIVAYLAQDMAMLNVTEGNVSGTTTVPVGYTLGLRTLDVLYEEGGWVVPALEAFPAAAFSYLTPEIPGVTIAIEALAAAPGGELSYAVRSGLPTTSTGVQLELPEVPSLLAPPDGAADLGYDTPFSWAAPGGGVSVVLIAGPPGTFGHVIVTDDAATTIPDLRPLAFSLVPIGPYTWQVVHLPRYPDVDASVHDADGLLGSWPLNAFFLPQRDGAWANSLQRGFTTIP